MFVIIACVILFLLISIATTLTLMYYSSDGNKSSFSVIASVCSTKHTLILFPVLYPLYCIQYAIYSRSNHFTGTRIYDPVLECMIKRAVRMGKKYPQVIDNESSSYCIKFKMERSYIYDLDDCLLNNTKIIISPLLIRNIKNLKKQIKKEKEKQETIINLKNIIG